MGENRMGKLPIIGVYLAAGMSTRMRKNKLNLPFRNAYIGSMAFQAALESKLDWTLAVTRKGDPLHWLDPFSKSEGWCILQCPDAEKGQGYSLKNGVKAASAMGAGAIVVLLADQPLVSSSIINRMLENYKEPYTAASKNGVPMPPVIISRKLFPAVMELSGDTGARSLLRRQGGHGFLLELDDKIFMDIDSEDDYHHLVQMEGS